MQRRLADELKSYGCDIDPDEFRDLTAEMLHNMHRAWTDEELLYHPYDALRYCAAIRARSQDSLPDDLILRTLVNTRKRSGRKRD